MLAETETMQNGMESVLLLKDAAGQVERAMREMLH